MSSSPSHTIASNDPHYLDAVYHAAILAVLSGLPPRVVLRGEHSLETAAPDPQRLAQLKAVELDILGEMLESMFRLWRVREEARKCWENAITSATQPQAAVTTLKTRKRKRMKI